MRLSNDDVLVYRAIVEIFRERDQLFHRKVYDDLKRDYSEPQRHYHTLRHIGEMLTHANSYDLNQRKAFLAAILYHDAVYEPERYVPGFTGPSNEQASADKCTAVLLKGGVDQATIERAAELIIFTQTHKAPDDDHEAKLFMDIDMSILGTSHQRYSEYAAATAKEYLSVFPPEGYFKGRQNFLRKALDQPPVFKTQDFLGLEFAARVNMRWELVALYRLVQEATPPPYSPEDMRPA